jgi:UDP-2,3-diacylglucosamine pyrophosphatase LpxH
MKVKIEALFISDVHLGARGVNADKLLEVLKEYEPKYLFLVGDIIDGWLLKKRFYWEQTYTNVIRKILSYSKSDVKVIYITGNHDEFLRQFSGLKIGNIEIYDEYIYNNTYITHGDLYDGVVKLKWLGVLGSIGYDFAIFIDRKLKKIGLKRSLSKFIKNKVKEAIKFITSFEKQLIHQSKKRNCDTVICGHIHNPEDKIVDGVNYLNCGDWIENNSYITYQDGKYTLHYK